eukprot:15475037-Alexandrium_andersonii.AAC.1
MGRGGRADGRTAFGRTTDERTGGLLDNGTRESDDQLTTSNNEPTTQRCTSVPLSAPLCTDLHGSLLQSAGAHPKPPALFAFLGGGVRHP